MLTLPSNHSVISSDALLPVIKDRYEIGEGKECRFICNGLNDTYLIISSTGKYILRIYKAHWRTRDDVAFEVELLLDLKNKGIPVSAPIAQIGGDYVMEFTAPEGNRFAVLFTFADGGSSDNKEENFALYGKEAAKMHLAMDVFQSVHERFQIDLDHLIDRPLQSIRRFLSHRPEDYKYLESLSKELRRRIEEMSPELEWGLCHGDLHGGNVHFGENATLTHFDFDCGGFGWRAYDIAVLLWARVRSKQKEDFTNKLWDAFLAAYQEHKTLSGRDLQAIPLFVAIREIWLMGLHTGNSQIWGSWQDDRYFSKNLSFLRNWCEVHSIENGVTDKLNS